MGNKHRSLKNIFHMSPHLVEDTYQTRLHGSSTINWPYTVGEYQLFCVITAELATSMEKIWSTSLQIQNLWLALPLTARFHYLKTLLIEELQSTNEIEQVHSTRQEIATAINAVRNGSTDSKRFTELARSYINILDSAGKNPIPFPTTLQKLRTIYDNYFAQEVDEDEQPDGELFRAKAVHITTGSTTIHQGTNGENSIKTNLSLMLNSAHNNNSPQLLTAMIEHFMFEHTHPFYDGNGRMGRYLLGLRIGQFLPLPLTISLSREIIRQKTQYYKAFQEIEHPLNRAEATFFAQTMLTFLEEASDYLLDSLRTRREHLTQLAKNVSELPEEQAGVLYLLGQIHLFGSRSDATLNTIAEFLELSNQTARKRIRTLEKQGMVQILKSKPLIFGLTDKAITMLGLNTIAVVEN